MMNEIYDPCVRGTRRCTELLLARSAGLDLRAYLLYLQQQRERHL